MILVDAGPPVALNNKNDSDHSRCVALAATLSPPLLTTWPCLTEAMYLLGGFARQESLWNLIEKDVLRIHDFESEQWRRMAELMRQYQNIPMDLADASLVTVAELLGERRILTIDSDFYIYRLADGAAFEVVS